MLEPAGIAVWLLIVTNTLAFPSRPRAVSAGAFSSSCQAVTTQNDADVLRCRSGKITWVNPSGSRKLVFDQCERSFNLCLHIKQSPSASVDAFVVRNLAGVKIDHSEFFVGSCFSSHGGNVTLDLRSRHDIDSDSTVEIEYTITSFNNQKSWSTCKVDCMCNRDHVVAASISSVIGLRGNLFAYRAQIMHHFNYKQTLNQDFIPNVNTINSPYEEAKLSNAPRSIEVTSMCEMEPGQTYFLSGNSSPDTLDPSRMQLRICCMAQSYKVALFRYIMKCL